MASGYVDVPHSTYDEWKLNTLGNEYDLDGYYGCQCLTAGHFVAMADGSYKDVKNIKKGEFVSTGNFVVTNQKRLAKVYKVYTKIGNFKVSEDHRFIINNGEQCYLKDVLNKELKINNVEPKKKYSLTNNELRFLGFYLGDGTKKYRYKTSKTPEIFVTVGTTIKEDYLFSLDFSYKVRLHSNHKAKTFSIVNDEHRELVQFIHELDKKKLTASFTREQFKYIIEGYIKADGCKKRSQFVCSSVDKELLLAIQYGCFLNGWQAKVSDAIVRKETNLCTNPKPIYRLSINPKKAPNSKVLKIEYIGEEYVYVLNLSGNHLYYADNVMHHNCWDYASLFWRNVGFPTGYPQTGPNGYAYECWTVSRIANAGTVFQLIYNKEDIKKGDVVVLDAGRFVGDVAGHIGFANEDYNGTNTLSMMGQNQENASATVGYKVTIDNMNIAKFLGAFRYPAWQPTPPPTPTEKHKFPWFVLTKRLNDRRNGVL